MASINESGFSPYPIGLSAEQSVQGIKNGYMQPETLKMYSNVITSIDPPDNSVIHNTGSFWFCEKTQKLYQPKINDIENVVIWFEV